MIHHTLDTQNNLKDVVMACQSEDTDNFHGIAIDVPDCFDPSHTGLGLYLPAGSQTLTPPSLSASLPNTPGSWTSHAAVSSEAPHLRDPKPNTWNQIFDGLTALTDPTVDWNETNPFSPPELSEIHCCAQVPPFQESTGLASALLPSERNSISLCYPNISECYRPDGHGSTPYHAPKIEQGDDWFEHFHKFVISPSNVTTQDEVISTPPPGTSLAGLYQPEGNSFYPFTSTIASPNTHQPSDLPSSGKAVRLNGSPHEDLYEKAKQSVERTRKRRRTGTPARANYVCHICGRRFSRNYNLRIHLPTHTPDRPKQWPCTWTGCDKVFTRRTDLIRHEKCIHTRDKDYCCVACGFSSSRKDTLRRHVEDGCQKRKIHGRKMSGKDRSSVVKLRAKPAPPSIAMSVPSAYTPVSGALHSSNSSIVHHDSIHNIAQGLG